MRKTSSWRGIDELVGSGSMSQNGMASATDIQRAILTPTGKKADRNLDTAEAGVTQDLRLEFKSAEELYAFLASHPRIRFVEVFFTDALGKWHHCTYSRSYVTIDNLTKGFGFDASSIPMMERISNSDFVMIPDPSTCFLDPFALFPTLHVVASISKPDGSAYEKCPRRIMQSAIDYMVSTGVADQVYFGPEAEYFVFNSARFSVEAHAMQFSIDGDEAYWNYNAGSTENPGHRANLKEGYMTSKPVDKLSDLRSETLLVLEQLGVKVEKHHHEVATCQMEINIRSCPGVTAADTVQVLKYAVKNCANHRGKTATFMPKPISIDNGSGMHFNLSLWKMGANLFYDENSSVHKLSKIGILFMSGILHHCRALLAFCCPTTNSYRRLVPDFEAPIHITYSTGNRSTAIRIPTFTDRNSTRLEFRMPDASCCPYIAFAAVLLAGLDGIAKNLPLPLMGEGDLFDENNRISKLVAKAPRTLGEALTCLEEDHQFLVEKNVFTETFINSFIAYKRKEVGAMTCCPHPREFMLYYGC